MDIEHFYTEAGAGEPLLLLHGNGEDSSYFEKQLAEFSKYYRVVAVDTRGHGKTPRGNAPFTIRQFAEDLASFLDRLAIEKTNLLGFSDGANIAIRFAICYPERVKKLILNGGNLNPSGIRRHIQLPIEIGYRITKLFASKSEEARRHMELLGLMVNDPDLSVKELEQIKAETLVIAGNKDMVKEKHTKQIAEAIPKATLKIVEGDHFIANRNPEAFNKAVMEFL